MTHSEQGTRLRKGRQANNLSKRKSAELGQKLKAAREALTLTQVNVAEKIGVSHVSVHRWEIGDAYPSGRHLMQLTKLFGLPPTWYEDDESYPQESGELSTNYPPRTARDVQPSRASDPSPARWPRMNVFETAVMFPVIAALLDVYRSGNIDSFEHLVRSTS